MRILVIEDEKKIANFIKRGLKEEHYVVETVFKGDDGMYLAEVNEYDLIILDIMLPGKDGITICKELRDRDIGTPILMLTARDSLTDKVKGLDSGADDYLTKPFAFEELLARVRSLLRRKQNKKTNKLKIADLELDQIKHKVYRANKEIVLTSKEYSLLEYFMLNVNQVITRTMISEHVWEHHFDAVTNVIDVYIRFLRTKIDADFDKKLLHTIRGVGYIIKDE